MAGHVGETMDEKTTGSCLCGSITFEVSGPFESFFLCHCSRCRKDTGSAHAANLFSARAEITWTSGRDLVRTYNLPPTRHQKSFCSNCGSAVPSIQLEGTLLVVPAGSLDSAVDMRPDAHICFGSRAIWDWQIDDIPRIDGLPG
jgi:hypothetical protein